MRMSPLRALLAGLALVGVASSASAQYPLRYPYVSPALKQPIPWAPDMMGPGFYLVNAQGGITGPHHYVRPYWCPETGFAPGPLCKPGARPVGPVQGMPPPPMLGQGLPTVNSFPSHPFARSPRDFFMFHENLEAERSRDLRPSIVP